MYRLIGNKKAGEKLLSIWWIVVLAIVGVGIVGGVLIFHNADVNVNEIEAGVLYERIYDCIVEQGKLDEKFLDGFNIYNECDLNLESFGKASDFYFKIDVFDSNNGRIVESLKGGDFSYEEHCEIKVREDGRKVKAKKYAQCFWQSEPIVYNDGGIKSGKLEIMAASHQYGKRNVKNE